ncbi:transcriptional regulator [Helicobacter pylori]|nr:transcriptional regulator [Helicobacter pylori]MDU9787169.1 transcriptional regulator [Helicobacter pylori]
MIARSFSLRERSFFATPDPSRFYHQKFMLSCVVKIQRYAIFK